RRAARSAGHMRGRAEPATSHVGASVPLPRPGVLPRGDQRPASLDTVESQESEILPPHLRSVPMPNSSPVRRLQSVPRLSVKNEPGAAAQIRDGRPELGQKPPTPPTAETEHDMAHTPVIYGAAGGHRLRPPQLDVVGIADAGLEHALHEALAEGAKPIELCG